MKIVMSTRITRLVRIQTLGLLLAATATAAEPPAFAIQPEVDRLVIHLGDVPITEYVYRDERILRPCFANLRTTRGVLVTRTHPPVAGVEAVDHDTMHPGLWIGFGDINGHDFWRNKGRIEHRRFTVDPHVEAGRLKFATESELLTAAGEPLGTMLSAFVLTAEADRWRLSWDASFRSDSVELAFGDQEEMGGGVRVATPLTEKSGGLITNANGLRTAAATWGQPAAWCDYSGTIDGEAVGITLRSAPSNFREPWWHNRDYGLMVANPFGRAAMKQGEPSRIVVAPNEVLRLQFEACIHAGDDYDPAQQPAQ